MKHPCLTPTCPALIARGEKYCPPCKTQAAQRDVHRRGTAAERGYDAAWQQERDEYARTHPWCEDHLERGERVPMVIVDHVHAIRNGGRTLNAHKRALCRSCHGFKTWKDMRAYA